MLGTLWYSLFSFHLLHDREWHMTAVQSTCIRHQCGLVNISWHLSTLFLNSFCQLDTSVARRIPSPGPGISWLNARLRREFCIRALGSKNNISNPSLSAWDSTEFDFYAWHYSFLGLIFIKSSFSLLISNTTHFHEKIYKKEEN